MVGWSGKAPSPHPEGNAPGPRGIPGGSCCGQPPRRPAPGPSTTSTLSAATTAWLAPSRASARRCHDAPPPHVSRVRGGWWGLLGNIQRGRVFLPLTQFRVLPTCMHLLQWQRSRGMRWVGSPLPPQICGTAAAASSRSRLRNPRWSQSMPLHYGPLHTIHKTSVDGWTDACGSTDSSSPALRGSAPPCMSPTRRQPEAKGTNRASFSLLPRCKTIVHHTTAEFPRGLPTAPACPRSVPSAPPSCRSTAPSSGTVTPRCVPSPPPPPHRHQTPTKKNTHAISARSATFPCLLVAPPRRIASWPRYCPRGPPL